MNKDGLNRWVLGLVMTTVAVIAVLAAAGARYTRSREAATLAQLTPRGELIPLRHADGLEYRVHLYCVGPRRDDAPTVILLHGGGDNSLVWAAVQPEVAGVYRVCSYDRAGYGWSERGPQPRSASRNAEELRQLLSQAGLEPPYILVGHSIAGLVIQQYAHRYPMEVARLVYLDSINADQMVAQGTLWMRIPLVETSALQLAASSGLLRLAVEMGLVMLDESGSALPDELQREDAALRLRVAGLQTLYDEQAAAISDVDELHRLGAVDGVRVSVLDAYTDEAGKRAVEARAHHWAKLSSRVTLIPVEGSGHHIQLDRPDAVIDTVLSNP